MSEKRTEDSIWARSRQTEEDSDAFLIFVDKIRQFGIEVDRLEKISSLIGTEKELTKTKDLLKEGRKAAQRIFDDINKSENNDKNKKVSLTEKKEYERVIQERDKIEKRFYEVISESEKKLTKIDFSKKFKGIYFLKVCFTYRGSNK
jgi:hypothetical protein